jgi:dihydrofolate reductase
MNLITCISLNHCIGKDGKLATRIPEDLARFKKLTTGNIVVMGANTFFGDLKGTPLPNRTNVVLTSKAAILDYKFDKDNNLYFLGSLVMLTKVLPTINEDSKQVFCIGGAATYQALLPQVNTMYITHTPSIVKDGDTFFNVNWSEWDVAEKKFTDNCTFAKYVRK